MCNRCEEQELTLDTSTNMDGRTSHALRIISGSTYTKVLHPSLGIQSRQYQETIRLMYSIVKEMVDKMCTEATDDMKRMDQKELGSWSRAVTMADGA